MIGKIGKISSSPNNHIKIVRKIEKMGNTPTVVVMTHFLEKLEKDLVPIVKNLNIFFPFSSIFFFIYSVINKKKTVYSAHIHKFASVCKLIFTKKHQNPTDLIGKNENTILEINK